MCSGVAVVLLGLAQFSGLAVALFPTTGPNDQAVYSVFGNQDFFGGYAAITLALASVPALSQGRNGWWWALAAVILLSGVVISSSRSAWLAAGVGMLVALLLARKRLAWGRLAVCALLAAVIAGGAMMRYPERTVERVAVTMTPVDEGGHLRLWFWSGAVLMLQEHPFFGVGLGNYAYWSPRYQGAALDAPGGQLLMRNTLHTIHPHSEPLEIATETGMLGLGFMLWMIARLLGRRGPEWAGLAALFVFTLFNSALHSPPFGVAAILLGVMLLARGHKLPLHAGESVVFPAVTVVLAGTLLTAVWWTTLVPSYLLAKAEAVHVEDGHPNEEYQAVIDYAWPMPDAHEELAIALYEQGDYDAALTQLLIARDGLDTGRLHLLTGRVSLLLGELPLARESMRAVLMRWPWHTEAWRVLYDMARGQERAALLEHAERWGIEAMPPSESGAQQPMRENAGDADPYRAAVRPVDHDRVGLAGVNGIGESLGIANTRLEADRAAGRIEKV